MEPHRQIDDEDRGEHYIEERPQILRVNLPAMFEDRGDLVEYLRLSAICVITDQAAYPSRSVDVKDNLDSLILRGEPTLPLRHDEYV